MVKMSFKQKMQVAVGAGLVAFGLNSCIKPKVRHDIPMHLEETVSNLTTITNTADEGTKLNETLAAKVRKVAEYALTKDKGKRSLQISEHVTTAYASFEVNGVGYSVRVLDYNESDVLGKDAIDTLQLEVYSPWENNERKVLHVRDVGLDGRANWGDRSVLRDDYEDSDNPRQYFDKENNIGLEHQEFYQNKLENVLNTLIEFYEKE